MTELRHLEHFVAVYRRKSFRAGADELGVSQSNTTKIVQHLEAELGVRLFNRTTRSVEPTDTARQLIGRAEKVLQLAGSFNEEARLLAGGEIGAVRVGAIALASETLVARALANLSRTHPGLEVEVVVGSSDVYRDLATGQCDVVVGDEVNFAESSHASSLRMTPIHQEPLVLVHRPGHPAAGAKTLDALLAFPLAVPSRYFNENRLFEAMSTQASGLIVPRYRLNSLNSCVTLAATSDVVTLAPRSIAERAQLDGAGLVLANFDVGIDIRLALLTVASNALTPAVRAFQQALVWRLG